MKWDHKGHQYDLIGRKICTLSEKQSAFYIWGAGTFGISFYELFSQEIKIEGFIDSDPRKQGTIVCGIPVYAPEHLKTKKVFVLVSAGWTKDIYQALDTLGYIRGQDYLHIDDFTSLYYWYKYKKVYLSDITFPITEKCTLKCRGCSAFVPQIKNPVLRYSTSGPDRYAKALRQLCESVALLRKNCERWDIDPDRIVLCGFSAGGHLAASLGCYGSQLSEWTGSNIRPNALLLGYPVISAGRFAHRESIKNCLQEDKYKRESLGLENHVDNDMPPVFLWACTDDGDVPVQNSLLFSTALAERSVPFELHIFHQGGHGASLGDECTARIEGQINERYAEWFQASLTWLREVL